MIKIEKQTTHKNPLCEQRWPYRLTSRGELSQHLQHGSDGLAGITQRGQTMLNYWLRSDFTDIPENMEFTCWVPQFAYQQDESVLFLSILKSLSTEIRFIRAVFNRVWERQPVMMLRSQPEPLPWPAQLTLRQQTPTAPDPALRIYLVPGHKTKTEEALPFYLLLGQSLWHFWSHHTCSI